LPWAINCSAALSLRMICSGVNLIRFVVKIAAQLANEDSHSPWIDFQGPRQNPCHAQY
jgi:hypothetical protein